MQAIILLLSVFVFFKNGKWGLVNNKGQVVKDAIFDELEDPNRLGFAVAKLDSGYCLVDSLGNFVLLNKYSSLSFISDTLLVAKEGNRSFVCNIKGESLAESEFDSVSYDSEGNTFLHTSSGKIGMISRKQFLNPVYDSIWFSDQHWLVSKNGKIGAYDLDLNRILPVEYDWVKSAYKYFIVQKNEKFGLYDFGGNVQFECKFQQIEMIDWGHLVATDEKGKARLYDIQQKKSLVEGAFETIRFFPGSDEIFLTRNNDMEGLVDKNGNVLIGNKYDNISYLGMGRIAATDSLGDHMYDMKGKKLSKQPLGEIQAFDSIPVTTIYFDGLKGAVNLDGEMLLLPKYSYVRIADETIIYHDRKSKNKIIFDANGRFVESIRNFGTIRIVDTTKHEDEFSRKQRVVIRKKGERFGRTVLPNISMPISRSGQMFSIANYFLFDSVPNRSMPSSSSFLDISISVMNSTGIAPAILTSGKLVLLNQKGSIINSLAYITAEGKRQLKPFGSVGKFSEGLAPVNFGNANENLKKKYSYKITDERNVNTYFGVLENEEQKQAHIAGNWGFIDDKGKAVIPPQFHKIEDFKNGRAIVSIGDWKYVLINQFGLNMLNTSYKRIERVEDSDSLYFIHVDCNEIGFMDRQYNMMVAPKYKEVKAVGNRLVLVQAKNRNWCFKTFSGKPITDSIYQRAKPFSEGLAAVYFDNFWGYIDTTGKIILKPKYTSASDFMEGRAMVTISGKAKIINTKGGIIAKAELKQNEGFEDGIAIVTRNKKFGFLKSDGDWLVAPYFDQLSKFDSEGFAFGTKDKMAYKIDKEGNIEEIGKSKGVKTKDISKVSILRFEKMDFESKLQRNFPNLYIPENLRLFRHNSFVHSTYVPYKPFSFIGLVSKNGTMILPPIYQYIKPLDDGVFKVYHQNSIGYYDINKGWLYKQW